MKPETFKARLRQQGGTVLAWAAERGYNPTMVYQLLNGQLKGHYGKSHEIAVALGLKPPKNLEDFTTGSPCK
ncbi:MAG: DNA-binding protein [Candidatus Accumulibacter sp.]|jgi:gp16 family phage-associated protein|nr:DNA-binding protein [Accumulibacter sp.]